MGPNQICFNIGTMTNNRNNCQNESKVRTENPFKSRTIADSLVIKERTFQAIFGSITLE